VQRLRDDKTAKQALYGETRKLRVQTCLERCSNVPDSRHASDLRLPARFLKDQRVIAHHKDAALLQDGRDVFRVRPGNFPHVVLFVSALQKGHVTPHRHGAAERVYVAAIEAAQEGQTVRGEVRQHAQQ
jgi:hypothetical protein